jgi:hypothetical protein
METFGIKWRAVRRHVMLSVDDKPRDAGPYSTKLGVGQTHRLLRRKVQIATCRLQPRNWEI